MDWTDRGWLVDRSIDWLIETVRALMRPFCFRLSNLDSFMVPISFCIQDAEIWVFAQIDSILRTSWVLPTLPLYLPIERYVQRQHNEAASVRAVCVPCRSTRFVGLLRQGKRVIGAFSVHPRESVWFFCYGIPAEANARATASFNVWCLLILPEAIILRSTEWLLFLN